MSSAGHLYGSRVMLPQADTGLYSKELAWLMTITRNKDIEATLEATLLVADASTSACHTVRQRLLRRCAGAAGELRPGPASSHDDDDP